jgi:hypothetical protein
MDIRASSALAASVFAVIVLGELLGSARIGSHWNPGLGGRAM